MSDFSCFSNFSTAFFQLLNVLLANAKWTITCATVIMKYSVSHCFGGYFARDTAGLSIVCKLFPSCHQEILKIMLLPRNNLPTTTMQSVCAITTGIHVCLSCAISPLSSLADTSVFLGFITYRSIFILLLFPHFCGNYAD